MRSFCTLRLSLLPPQPTPLPLPPPPPPSSTPTPLPPPFLVPLPSTLSRILTPPPQIPKLSPPGHRNCDAKMSKHATRYTNPYRSEIRRQAMDFIHRTHSVITTYRRFFEARSAHFAICKHYTRCSQTPRPNHLPPSQLPALLPGKLQAR